MSVSNDTDRIQYDGNNSDETAYAIPFKFFQADHIRVTVTDEDDEVTILDEGDYVVTGAGDDEGGELVTDEAIPDTSTVLIERVMDNTQPYSFTEGQRLPMRTLENAYDWLCMLVQQAYNFADRIFTLATDHIADVANPHEVTKTQVGLGNADNTSDVNKPVSTAQAAAIALKIPLTQRAAANGVATLGADVKVPWAQLPAIFQDGDPTTIPTDGLTIAQTLGLRDALDMPALYVLEIGQSNMNGGEDVPVFRDGDLSARVEIHNTTTGEFETWDLTTPTVNENLGNYLTGERVSLAWHIAKAISKKVGRVRVVLSAMGGQNLTWWGCETDGSHTPSAEGWQRVLEALAVVPRIDLITFMQGESNTGATHQTTQLGVLIDELYAQAKIPDSAPFLIGELSTLYPEINAAYKAMVAADDRLAFVPRSRYQGILLNGVHFPAESLANIGDDFAARYISYADRRRAEFTDTVNRLMFSQLAREYGEPQPKYTFSVTKAQSVNTFSARFNFVAYVSRIGNADRIEGEISVISQGATTDWTVACTGRATNNTSFYVEVVNPTDTTADIVLHLVNVTASGAGWFMDAARINYCNDQGDNITGETGYPHTVTLAQADENDIRFTAGKDGPRSISGADSRTSVALPEVTTRTISSNTLANPSVVTTSAAHGLTTGQYVTISGSNSTPVIDGLRRVTVIDATSFSVPVNVTVAGTAGTVTKNAVVAMNVPSSDYVGQWSVTALSPAGGSNETFIGSHNRNFSTGVFNLLSTGANIYNTEETSPILGGFLVDHPTAGRDIVITHASTTRAKILNFRRLD